MASQQPPQALHPNHSIGRSLAIFDPESPLASMRGSRSNLASPTSSGPPSPRSTISRSGRNTPIDAKTPIVSSDSPSRHKSDEPKLLSPEEDAPDLPLIICFHGSGRPSRSEWSPLARELSRKYRVLFYPRQADQDTAESVDGLISYLDQHDLTGPYVLLAHSHGGAHARCFLHRKRKEVAGMVLVETGQEAIWDEKIQDDQEDSHVLGERPLVVIKGNSLLPKWQKLAEREQRIKEKTAAGQTVSESEKASLMMTRNQMGRWEKEDIKLKRRQLKLSKNHRFVHLADVGHGVVRDQPTTVAAEVDWVMANLLLRGGGGGDKSGGQSNSSRSSSRAGRASGEIERKGTLATWLRKAGLALTPRPGAGAGKEEEGRRASR